MNKYKEVFPNRNTLLAVVHCADAMHTLRNAKIAFDCGVDGIFLINHGKIDRKELMGYYHVVREKFPDKWIGVNLLGVELKNIFGHITRSVDGVWTDDAGAPDENWIGPCQADKFLQEKAGWNGLYFGGTAFKYTATVEANPAAEARRAMPYVDVVTTSGSGTNSAPQLEKLKAMREAIGDFPLANASGNKLSNIEAFSEYVDAFITASSLLEINPARYSVDEFDPESIYKMVRLIERLNS